MRVELSLDDLRLLSDAMDIYADASSIPHGDRSQARQLEAFFEDLIFDEKQRIAESEQDDYEFDTGN